MLDLEKNELKKLSKEDVIVKEYMEKLEELNNDEKFRYVVSVEEDIKLTKELLEDCARKEGIEEGRKEGSTTKAIEIAKSLIRDKIPLEKIIKYTGLTVKEIEKLK